MALSVEEVEKLRAAGFSDEEIVAYDKDQSAAPAAPAPVDPSAPSKDEEGLPIFDINASPPPTTPVPENTYTEDFAALLPSATDAAKWIVQNPLTAATGAAGGAAIISALPGVRNVPPFKQINETRQNIMARVAPDAAERALNTEAKQLSNQKMAIEIEERQFKLNEAKDAAHRKTLNALSQEYGPAQQRVAAQAQPVPDKPVVFRQQAPGVTPGAGGQVPVQGPPNANNYMQRINNLAETYGPAQQTVRQQAPVVQAQPAPQPAQQVPNYRGSSGMTYRPIGGGGGMRGGGGGGGGGSLMQDPLNRRFRPLQY